MRWIDLVGTFSNVLDIGRGKSRLNASAITAQRTHTLPNASGTLALLEQVKSPFGAVTLANNAVATTETIVARWSIAANALASLDTLGVALAGQVSSTATLTFRIRFGAAGTTADALLCTLTVSAAGVANAYHFLEAMVAILSATTATATGSSQLAAGVVGNATAAFAAATVNLTVANFLSVTLVQSVAQTYTSRAAKLSL